MFTYDVSFMKILKKCVSVVLKSLYALLLP